MPSRRILVGTGEFMVVFVNAMPLALGYSTVKEYNSLVHAKLVDKDDTHIAFEVRGTLVLVERSNIADMTEHQRETWIPTNLAGQYHRPTPGLPGM